MRTFCLLFVLVFSWSCAFLSFAVVVTATLLFVLCSDDAKMGMPLEGHVDFVW